MGHHDRPQGGVCRTGHAARRGYQRRLAQRHRCEPAQRREAVALSQALAAVRRRVAAGERDAVALRKVLTDRIAATPGAVLDYAEIVDADTLKPIERLAGPALALLAVRFGATRLIDNLPLSAPVE